MEGKSNAPGQKYPNQLGMSDEEIEEGLQVLIRTNQKLRAEKLREAQRGNDDKQPQSD